MPAPLQRWKPPRLSVEPTKERAHYRTADWKAKRLRILTRDHCRCRVCQRVVSGRDAHVDHVVPLEEGGTDSDDNLQVLCQAHHGAKTRSEQRRRGVL